MNFPENTDEKKDEAEKEGGEKKEDEKTEEKKDEEKKEEKKGDKKDEKKDKSRSPRGTRSTSGRKDVLSLDKIKVIITYLEYSLLLIDIYYSKICLKWPLKNRQNKGLDGKWYLNAGR